MREAALSGFGVENIPLGVARRPDGSTGCVSRLGGDVVDLCRLARDGALDVAGLNTDVLADASLNRLLAHGRAVWEGVRHRLVALVEAGDERWEAASLPVEAVQMLMPVTVGDFVDFSASLHHATNMGRLLRPGGDPLPPNWRRAPVAYHGRAGSLVASGRPIVRPHGQYGRNGGLGPTAQLDFEAEVGFVVGVNSQRGRPIPAGAAADHVAGVVLINDWSARDVQAFESQPLGPFLSKSFATSMSPWLVSLAALEPFRTAPAPQDPPPPPYLATAGDWAYAVRLEVLLQSQGMRVAGLDPAVLSRPQLAALYWTMPQLVAHATVNGAPTRTGDLFASGTLSGPGPGSVGSMAELAGWGERPIALPDGTTRAWLEDGDTVTMRAWAGGEGGPLVSLGEVSGSVQPARNMEE